MFSLSRRYVQMHTHARTHMQGLYTLNRIRQNKRTTHPSTRTNRASTEKDAAREISM